MRLGLGHKIVRRRSLSPIYNMAGTSYWTAADLAGDFQTVTMEGTSSAGDATLGSTSSADSNDPLYLDYQVPGAGNEIQPDYVDSNGAAWYFAGPNLVTNGTFDTDLSGWTDSGTAWVWDSGVARDAGTGTSIFSQASVTTSGRIYYYSYELAELTGGTPTVQIGGVNHVQSSNGTHTGVVTATGANIFFSGAAALFTIDNVVVREVFRGPVSGYRYISDELVTNASGSVYRDGVLPNVNYDPGLSVVAGKYYALRFTAANNNGNTSATWRISGGSAGWTGTGVGSGFEGEKFYVVEAGSSGALTMNPDNTVVDVDITSCSIREVSAYGSPQYVYLDGASGSYISQADEAGNSVTGDIDIRVKVALDDWTPAAINDLLSKWTGTGNQRSYRIQVNTGGLLGFVWSEDGIANPTGQLNSTALPSLIDGEITWIRVTVDVDNGSGGADANFYTSTDGQVWTQVGATVTYATSATSFHDGSAGINLGAVNAGTADLATGKFYEAQIRNGIDGTVVSQWRAQDMGDSGGRDTAPTPLGDWTLNGGYSVQVPSGDYVYLPGTAGNYISGPDLNQSGDLTLTLWMAADDWISGAEQALLGQYNTTGNQRSYLLSLSTVGWLQFKWSTDGTYQAANDVNSAVIVPTSDGEWHGVRVKLDISASTVDFEESADGENWTALGTQKTGTGTSLFDTTALVEVGSVTGGTAALTSMKVGWATIHDNATATGDPVWRWDSAESTQTGYTDPYSGEVNTINRSATGLKSTLCTRPVFVLNAGATNYAVVADHADLDIAAADDATIWWYGRIHADSVGNDVLLAKKNTAAGTDVGYNVMLSAATYRTAFADGSVVVIDTFPSTIDSSAALLAGVRNVSVDTIAMYVDSGISGSAETDTTTATLANALGLYMGAESDAGNPADGAEVWAWGVIKGTALTSSQLNQLKRELDTRFGGRIGE